MSPASFKISRPAGVVAAVEIPILLAIAPALLFPTPRRLMVLALVPIVWACARTATGRAVPRTPLNVVLYVLLAMVAVSLYATFDIQFSLGKVSGVLLGVLLYWAVVRWVTTPERLRFATGAFLLAGAGLAVIGVLGTNWFEKFPLLGAVAAKLPKAIRGIPGAEEGFHPNAVAGCLVLFVPLQIALLLARPSRRLNATTTQWRPLPGTAIQSALLILTAGTLLLTQSRGAWVGIAVATLSFLFWYGRRTRVLAAVLVVLVFFAAVLGPQTAANMAISQSGPGMAGNVSGRVELWSRAIYGIQDFPFTGMGMNAFRKVMPVLYPTFLSSPDFDVAHAHNHLLQAGLDLGIPGLIAYVSIWTLLGILLVRVYHGSADRGTRALAGGLGAGFIAHFAFNMTDAIPLGAKVGVLFWLALALVVSLHERWRAADLR
jgi:putative inorganic carbon (HCO3(-)) transporter